MNENHTETTLGGMASWIKHTDGSYTKIMTVYYKHGKIDFQILEENVSEKDYFKRKLDGTA